MKPKDLNNLISRLIVKLFSSRQYDSIKIDGKE